MKKLIILSVVLVLGAAFYFSQTNVDKNVFSIQEKSKSPVKVKSDFKFSSQELEQMTPAITSNGQVDNSQSNEQVFSSSPE